MAVAHSDLFQMATHAETAAAGALKGKSRLGSTDLLFESLVVNILGPLDHSTQMTQIIKIYADRLALL